MNAFSSLPLFLFVAVMGVSGPLIAGTLLIWRRRIARARRRSPLTADLLRGPGHSIRTQLDALRDDVDELAVLLITIPMALYAVHITQSYILAVQESVTRTVTSLIVGVAAVLWVSVKLLRLSVRMDRMRVGLDAEIAVGQELDQLMRDGAIVFHDVPAEHFNIDHVVICQAGIYAVETKGRAKPIRGRGKEDATVEFDGSTLRFPTWSETEPLAQAQRQARWLEQWVSSAVGAPASVTAVLAIPGWYIDRKARGSILIYNGKSPGFLLRRTGASLSAEMMQRVAHQIDQRCRTVKPTYSK